MDMATLIKFLSKKGTRASKPHAEVALLALRQSYKCRAFICQDPKPDSSKDCHLLANRYNRKLKTIKYEYRYQKIKRKKCPEAFKRKGNPKGTVKITD